MTNAERLKDREIILDTVDGQPRVREFVRMWGYSALIRNQTLPRPHGCKKRLP